MLLKNITKKRDVKERIFRITQATFVIELRTYMLGHINVPFSPSLLLIQPYQFYAKCLIIVAKTPFSQGMHH
jgi:hypothetical protein